MLWRLSFQSVRVVGGCLGCRLGVGFQEDRLLEANALWPYYSPRWLGCAARSQDRGRRKVVCSTKKLSTAVTRPCSSTEQPRRPMARKRSRCRYCTGRSVESRKCCKTAEEPNVWCNERTYAFLHQWCATNLGELQSYAWMRLLPGCVRLCQAVNEAPSQPKLHRHAQQIQPPPSHWSNLPKL